MTDFTETRSMLKKAAMAEPGDTPARCGYHNLLEQTEHLSKGAGDEQRRQLVANIELQQKRLAAIKEDPSWAT